MDCMSMGSQSRMWLSHFHFHLVPFLNALSSSLFVTAVFFTLLCFICSGFEIQTICSDKWIWAKALIATPVFLPGEFHEHGSLWATVYGAAESQTRLNDQARAHTHTALTLRLNDISDKNSFWFISTTNLWLAFVFPWGNWRDWESSDYFLTILMQESFQATF